MYIDYMERRIKRNTCDAVPTTAQSTVDSKELLIERRFIDKSSGETTTTELSLAVDIERGRKYPVY